MPNETQSSTTAIETTPNPIDPGHGGTVIIDYQMGNLRSVQKALQRIGERAYVSSDPHRVANADRVVLPGVGAFRDAIRELRQRGLVEVIHQTIEQKKPFLGICLGLQLLFEQSEEFGVHAGLGILPGKVVRFQLDRSYKVPHMGWNQVHHCQPMQGIDQAVEEGSFFYFVHSYHCLPTDSTWVAATTSYSTQFVSAVARRNVMAVQFHPEKSQSAGLQLLRNFISCSQPPTPGH
ncbi:MAG: imidazole glycerol phosphate synthase subunit HisH [Pirellulaceae bacterium]